MFTINRLGLPSELRRCLGTTNLIDNGPSALRDRVGRVKHWQSGSMALRWTAVAFDAMILLDLEWTASPKVSTDEPLRDRYRHRVICSAWTTGAPNCGPGSRHQFGVDISHARQVTGRHGFRPGTVSGNAGPGCCWLARSVSVALAVLSVGMTSPQRGREDAPISGAPARRGRQGVGRSGTGLPRMGQPCAPLDSS
jgi:hypothetical protein